MWIHALMVFRAPQPKAACPSKGRALRDPWAVLRKVGRQRRFTRKDLDGQEF
jgi:hypothetical protein